MVPLRLAPGSMFGNGVKSREVASFRLSERVYPPGFQTPRHSHKWPLFCFVIDGAYTETYGVKTRSCAPSTLLFHPADELHAEHFLDSGGRSLIVEIQPEWLGRIREQAKVTDSSADFRGGIFGALGARLYREFLTLDTLSPLVVEGLLLEMIGEASRGVPLGSTARLPRWLQQAHDLLHACFAQQLTLDEIATTVGVHRVYLAQAFRRHFRCTVGEYVRSLRVEYARHQITNSDTPLAQIALAAGFADQSHFTRTFKHYTGISPSHYRANFRLPGQLATKPIIRHKAGLIRGEGLD